jgi:hypothetical protein
MRFDRDRLIFIALVVLDEVQEQAGRGPVKPSFSTRLALATLFALGQEERRVFEDFWKTMQDPYPRENREAGNYLRSTYMRTYMTGIARGAGVELTVNYGQRLSAARRKAAADVPPGPDKSAN